MSAESEKAAAELRQSIQTDSARLIAEKLVGPNPPPGRVEEVTREILKPSPALPAQPKPKA